MSFQWMGVVNATPNSFSDGGEYQNTEALTQKLNEFRALSLRFFDLGGESTAPMNSPITSEEELVRLHSVLKYFENDPLSIDTYKSETITALLKTRSDLIWNDVSGQLDSELLNVLTHHPKLQTIFCHNLAPARAQTGQHMNFVSTADVILSLEARFAAALEWFDKHSFKSPMLDFCFGFSKTFEQNWQILKSLPQFIDHFEAKYGEQDWIIAISRKSFFKQLARADAFQPVTIQTEYMQGQYLMWLRERMDPKTKLTVRLHDPSLAHAFNQVGHRL